MDFYKRMQYVCRSIPYGRVATYGQIAFLCGKPKNARQVGYALNRDLAGEDIPAHRIVSSSGILSGADAFETPNRQKELLQSEGVSVKATAKGWETDLKKFVWRTSTEDAEKFQIIFDSKGI